MAAASGRYNHPDGFLVRDAVLLQTGPLPYPPKLLGLDGDEPIIIHRSQESISHPETLRRLRGAPLTIGHPTEEVRPDNWNQLAVGYVAGDPRVEGDKVLGNAMFASQAGIDEYQNGTRELSIGGYTLRARAEHDGRLTSYGPLELNHIGLVPKGRAGSGVRVFDIHPDPKGHGMNPEQLTQIKSVVADALKDAMPSAPATGGSPFDVNDFISKFTSSFNDKVEPLLQKVQGIVDEAEAAKQRAKATKLMDEAIAEATGKQKTEFEILIEARPLLSDEAWAAVKDKPAAEVVLAALGDDAPTGGKYSIDYLRGAMHAKSRMAADGAPSNGLPAGVTVYDGANGGSKRNEAIAAFAKMQDEQFNSVTQRAE